jgi:hypothetical protein
MTWDDLLEECKDAPVKIKKSTGNQFHLGLCMVDHGIPISISQTEFATIYNFILKHKLKKGFDLATAFGISALAMGLAIKQNRGWLLSMDSYKEEKSKEQPIGIREGELYKQSDGYIMASWLINHFKLDEHVTLDCGWSPIDTSRRIEDLFGKNALDVVVLDCPKSDDDFIRDLSSLVPFLADKFAIFVHDTHVIPNADKISYDLLGLHMTNILPNQKYPFMLITNL